MNAALLLVFARTAGFVFRAPGFSHPSVPHPVRAALAVFLALAIAPGVHARSYDGLQFIAILISEFAIGAAMGLGASVLYDGAYAGGRILDNYVGVKAIAPSVALVAPSGYGRIWSIAFTGGFFLLGAYRFTVLALAHSFVALPLGVPVTAGAWEAYASTLSVTIVLVAVAVSAPAIALAFVVQIALAALSRTIPRFAGFSLSFPLVFGAVLVVTAVSLPLLIMRSGTPYLIAPR